jgi:Tfp pilus assembly protein PilF
MGLFNKLFSKSSSTAAPPRSLNALAATPSPFLETDSPGSRAQRVYKEGLQMFEAGQKREALDMFLKANKIDPKCVDALLALARVFHAIDPKVHSLTVLDLAEQALSADPAGPDTRNMAAVANVVMRGIAFDA